MPNSLFRVMAVGDVMGRPGRDVLTDLLPKARARFQPDFVVVNGENSAGGFGITRKVYDQFTDKLGIDCITTGNHWADKPEIHDWLPLVDKILVPSNMHNVPKLTQGLGIYRTPKATVCVLNLSGQAFMHPGNSNPLKTLDQICEEIPSFIKIRLLDFHAEATSEKQGIAWYGHERLSLVYGTHSHVPTADERILAGRTGFLTDVGLTGSYDSVIGIKTSVAIQRLLTGEKKKFQPAKNNLWMCFLLADFDTTTGDCLQISRHRWELDRMDSVEQHQ